VECRNGKWHCHWCGWHQPLGISGRGGSYSDLANQTIIRRATLAEVRPLLALAESDDVQQIGLDSVVSGCAFFLLENGNNKLAYALNPVGTELWIQAAGGKGTANLTKIGLEVIEAQGVGLYSTVAFQTRRTGLVTKAKQNGFVVDGYILRKKI